MEAKELIKQAKESVVDQAYVKGCPNSPQEWFISTERLIPLQEMAIFKAGIREVVEWLERAKKIKVPKYQLKEWGIE